MPTLRLILAAILLPPVGLVMLWMRRGVGILKKVAGSLVIAAWTVFAMVLFFGLHFELDGSGIRPIFGLRRIDAHYAELEQSRARQKVERVATEVKPEAPAAPKIEAISGGTYWTDFRG